MNDRYLYFPMLGAAGLAGGVVVPWRRLAPRFRAVAAAAGLTALAALAALAVAAGLRVAVWQNEVSLWQDAVAKAPGSETVRFGLAAAYLRAGRSEDALKAYLQLL